MIKHLERDGVALFYEEAGDGEPPALLVHGWCCDHAYFAPQFGHFAERGHRVVAVDLRGHGQSDKPRQQYAMQVFADDLAWMCERLDLAKPVVVGHSMGGIVAFHTGELKVAEGLTLWPALQEELLNFRRKINLTTAHDTYEHWRDSDHDDLVLAVALACWWIRRRSNRVRVMQKPLGW